MMYSFLTSYNPVLTPRRRRLQLIGSTTRTTPETTVQIGTKIIGIIRISRDIFFIWTFFLIGLVREKVDCILIAICIASIIKR
jgi:hypothetical protein